MDTPKLLADREYLRQRLEPRPGDEFYLHLADLRLALEAVATQESIRVLDFGCGGSPYRSLFPNAQYLRADLPAQADIDYAIGPDGRIDAPDASFDLVLSSQVLEHVPDPRAYLAECRRLLKAGGRLACSTHGTFEDHSCPHDYWRWTADGLAREITNAGFTMDRYFKLTGGGRALFFLIERMLRHADLPRRTLMRFCLRPLRWLLQERRAYLHEFCDKTYAHLRQTAPDSPHWAGQTYYIAVLALARKAG